MPFGNRKKNILEDLLSSVLSQFKKYHPSGNLEFHYLDIFQSLNLHILMEKILSISLKLNFTSNTFGGYRYGYSLVYIFKNNQITVLPCCTFVTKNRG